MSSDITGVGYSSSTSIQGLFATTVPPTTVNQLSQNPFADPNGPFANLNLTTQQQQQIQQLFSQSSNTGTQTPTQLFEKVESLLTPTQQQTLRSDLETSGAAHHHHHHHAAAATTSTDGATPTDLASTLDPKLDTTA